MILVTSKPRIAVPNESFCGERGCFSFFLFLVKSSNLPVIVRLGKGADVGRAILEFFYWSSFLIMWCVARFGISLNLAFVWLFERMQMDANTFFYLSAVSVRLCELVWHSNRSDKCQTLACESNGLGSNT